MDATVFSVWVSSIGQLNAAQRRAALQALAEAAPPAGKPALADPAEASVEPELLSQIGQARQAMQGCPHCGGDAIGRWGRANGKPRYRCAACSRTFNPLTATPLAGLHYPERWPDQAQALIAGETIAKAAKRCAVSYTTAFRWRHRFLAALNQDKPAQLSGIVEADETFILESFKGKRAGMTRAPRQRGGKSSRRGLSKEQIPVMVARDRSGATIDAVLPAPGLPRPEAPEWHINNVNAYHGRLKEWMRRFHGVATANLPSYLSWRRTIEAFGTNQNPSAWIRAAAGLGPYQQAST